MMAILTDKKVYLVVSNDERQALTFTKQQPDRFKGGEVRIVSTPEELERYRRVHAYILENFRPIPDWQFMLRIFAEHDITFDELDAEEEIKQHCSACGKWKPLMNFYGKSKKQSRCIPCYNAAYGAYYRRSLREAKR